MFVRMVLRSHAVRVPDGVELDVPAEDIRERVRLHEISNAQGAAVLPGGILDYQAPRQQKISGKENARSAIIKCHVRRVVSRRRDHIDGTAAKLYLNDSVWPVREAKECAHRFQTSRHNLDRGKWSEL